MLDSSRVAEIRCSLRLAHRTMGHERLSDKFIAFCLNAYTDTRSLHGLKPHVFFSFKLSVKSRFSMSCSDCCQQELDLGTASRLGAVAHDLKSWSDVEIPDQPQEMKVNGLGGMASLTMAFGMCEEEVAADLSCWSLYVSERIYTTDWEILRGISLRDSFRFGGSLWRNRQHLDRNDQVFAWCRSCQPPS